MLAVGIASSIGSGISLLAAAPVIGIRGIVIRGSGEIVAEATGIPVDFVDVGSRIARRGGQRVGLEAPKGAGDVDDFIVPGQKWYHGTDADSADDIIRNGLDRKKLLGSDPVEGAVTPGFFVTDKLSDAEDYARLRGGERGKPGSILEWDDTEIGRFLKGVGKDNEAVIPFDFFDNVPRPRRPGG